jgi:hypothetical protein
MSLHSQDKIARKMKKKMKQFSSSKEETDNSRSFNRKTLDSFESSKLNDTSDSF